MRRLRPRRLRSQMGRSTSLPPMNAPIGPPSHHGNTSVSCHTKRVRRPSPVGEGSIGSRVNRPLPVTMPVWRTPITSPGSHSVIAIRSTSLIGPTLVSHRNSVPTPRVWSPVNLIATA